MNRVWFGAICGGITSLAPARSGSANKGLALCALALGSTIDYGDKEMNAEEFYKKVIADPALEKALEDATDSGTLDDFLKSNGCTASSAEVSSYISEHS